MPKIDELKQRAGVLLAAGKSAEAVNLCLDACRSGSAASDIWYFSGMLCARQGRFQDAIDCLSEVVGQQPGNVEVNFNLAGICSLAGNVELAIKYFTNVVDLDSGNVKAWYFLGNEYSSKADFDSACRCYRRALSINPLFARAYFSLVEIVGDVEDDELAAMEAVADRLGQDRVQQAYLQFSLSKCYERRGDYGRAFDCLERGNDLHRSTISYDMQDDINLFECLIDVFIAGFFAEHAGFGVADESPVFIVGMMRSGTTLIEQILSCHPQVCAAGEINDLRRVLFADASVLGLSDLRRQLEALQEPQVLDMANSYLDAIKAYSTAARYITNKTPVNFVWLGFVRLLFPQARIIHCVRSPLDTCLSIYKQYFTGEHGYAYNLEELGQYYLLYERLMAHWREVMPGSIYELSYEAMVNDQQGSTRQVLEFLDLPWDDACLDFYKAGKNVQTASISQVRKKLYTSSVKAWQQYEDRLATLINIVGCR